MPSPDTFVSVIIPTYNRAHLLVETLESVFRQDFAKIEIVVVDDGSTDDTRQALENFRRHRNFTYVFQENAGRSAARNNGLRLARGDYVMFLDSDDVLENEGLSELVKAAERDQESGIIAGDRVFVDDDLRRLDIPIALRPSSGFGSRDLKYDVIRTTFFAPSTYMIKRHLALELRGFNPVTEPAEDLDFLARACQQTLVSYSDKVIVKMRRHQGNTNDRELREASVRIGLKFLECSLELGDRKAASLWRLRISDDRYALGRRSEAFLGYMRFIVGSMFALQLSKVPGVFAQALKCALPIGLRRTMSR